MKNMVTTLSVSTCVEKLLFLCAGSNLNTSVTSCTTFQPYFFVLVPAISLWRFCKLCSEGTDWLLTPLLSWAVHLTH